MSAAKPAPPPGRAIDELVGFRRSFIAPVLGAMAERMGAKQL